MSLEARYRSALEAIANPNRPADDARRAELRGALSQAVEIAREAIGSHGHDDPDPGRDERIAEILKGEERAMGRGCDLIEATSFDLGDGTKVDVVYYVTRLNVDDRAQVQRRLAIGPPSRTGVMLDVDLEDEG